MLGVNITSHYRTFRDKRYLLDRNQKKAYPNGWVGGGCAARLLGIKFIYTASIYRLHIPSPASPFL